MTVLPNLAAENEALKRQLAEMAAKLAARPTQRLSFKVTAKKPDGSGSDGAISVYGLGRFPVTLYAASWERLLDAQADLRAFVATNASVISRK
jgi:hypothetical protein